MNVHSVVRPAFPVGTVVLSALVIAVALASGGCEFGPKAARLETEPKSLTLNKANDPQPIKLTIFNAEGEVVVIPEVAWTSSDPAVAEVDALGRVTAKKSGNTTITAKVEEITATVSVTVSLYTTIKPAAGDVQVQMGMPPTPVKADVLDEAGNTIAGAKVTFTSQNPGVVKVDEQGNLVAVGPGPAVVAVTAGDLTQNINVTVTPAAVANLSADKPNLELAAGATQNVVLTATDALNNPVQATYEWVSSNPAVVTVTPDGAITAVADGQAVITVTANPGGRTLAIPVSVGVVAAPPAGQKAGE